MARKKQYKPDIYASTGNRDTFAMIYHGLITSDAFQSLTCGEKMFYVICKIQSKSRRGLECLYKHGKEEGVQYNTDQDFVFPAEHMKEYGYDRSNGGKYLNALIKKGFIKRKEQNKHRYKVNVYSFTDEWKKDTNL